MKFHFTLLSWAVNRAYTDFANQHPHLPLPYAEELQLANLTHGYSLEADVFYQEETARFRILILPRHQLPPFDENGREKKEMYSDDEIEVVAYFYPRAVYHPLKPNPPCFTTRARAFKADILS